MKELIYNLKDTLGGGQVARIIIVLVLILLVMIVLRAIKKFLSKQVEDTDQRYKARKAVTFLGYILIVVAILIVYGDKLGNVGVALGIMGAGVAFALQEVITSLAGWFSITFSNTIKVGDRVKIGEIRGDIIDIGVFKTTIMEVGDWVDGDLYNGRITELSNGYMFRDPIQNYSSDYPFLWDEISVPIRTESNYELAKKLFTKVADEVCGDYAHKSEATWDKMKVRYRVENAEVDPMVTLSFDENWITFKIRYIVDYRKRRTTKDKLYTRLLEEIEKYDNIIMIAATSVEVTNIISDNSDDASE